MNYLEALKQNCENDGVYFVKCESEGYSSIDYKVKDESDDVIKDKSSDPKIIKSHDNKIEFVKSKNKKDFQPSKSFLEAKSEMLKLCKPSDDLIDSFLTELKHVINPEGRIVKVDVSDDEIKTFKNNFSKKKFLESKSFVFELEKFYFDMFNFNVRVKILKPKEDNVYKILIKKSY